jgi:tetratricopeptide (TPR) repeat protein
MKSTKTARKKPARKPAVETVESRAERELSRGVERFEEGETKEAVLAFEAALATGVRDAGLLPLILKNLASALQRLRSWERMLEITTSYVTLADATPQHHELVADAYGLHAIALQHVGRLEDALVAVNTGVAAKPIDTFLLWEKACVLVLRGDRPGALAVLEEVVTIDPDLKQGISEDEDFATLRSDPTFKALMSAD